MMSLKRLLHTHYKRARGLGKPLFFISGLIVVATIGLIVQQVSPYTVSVSKKNSGALLQEKVDVATQSGTTSKILYGTVPESALSATNPNRAADLKRIKDAGFSVVRVGFNWSIIEPQQGKFVWTDTDNWLKAIKDAGLRPLIEIDRVPTWNRPAACKSDANCGPLKTDEFGAFAATAVKRYKTNDVVAWEIWNEPNTINFWKPIPNANQYAHLLESSYKAIKKADPNTTVLLGGLAGDSIDDWGSSYVDPRTFLAQVYAAGGGQYFDAVAYHPYIKEFGLANQNSVHNGWAKMSITDTSIRSIMTDNGDKAKKVWITEFGMPTGGNGTAAAQPLATYTKGTDHVTFEAQSAIAQSVFDDMRNYDWIQSFIWYSYKDNSGADTNAAASYGLWKSNNQPKPVLDIIKKQMSAVR